MRIIVMRHFSGAPAPSPAIFALTHRHLDVSGPCLGIAIIKVQQQP